MQRADLVPFGRMGIEIGRSHFRACRTDFLEPGKIAQHRLGIFGAGKAEQGFDGRVVEHRAGAEENPRTFTATLGDAGFVQYLDMARDPGLALPQNLYDFADRKLQLPYQQRDSHPRRIG